jgi:hypothetical protein
MKSSFSLIVVSIVCFPALSAWAAPIQDLGRIDDLVNQARGLADSARSNERQSTAGLNDPTTGQRRFDNPFARAANGTAGQSALGAASGVGVDVGGDSIRIEAGGRQFTIPRVGGNTGPDSMDPPVRAPARNGLAYSANRGHADRVSAAMKTANDYRSFAEAARLFRSDDFAGSLAKINSIENNNTDPPIEQFHALCEFANGDYMKSAELAYAAVANSPFYSWEQLRNYYGNSASYAQQYRRLQTEVAEHQTNHSLRFLLGYHHLMLGHREHAAREFEFVLTKLPGDPIVTGLLSISHQQPPAPIN